MSVTRKVQCFVLGMIACILIVGFLRSNVRGDITPVVLTGQPAPGTVNGRFSGIVGGASVNAAGDMAFTSMLDVGGVPSAGIFAIYNGVVSPIALEGQAVSDRSNLFFGGGLGHPQMNKREMSSSPRTSPRMQPGTTSAWGVF